MGFLCTLTLRSRRDQLARLIRYTARGAVSLERLREDTNGDLVYTFTHPWSDGTTGIRLSPWNSWRIWPPLCPCRGSTWCAMVAVWHRTATCVGRLSPRQQGVVEQEDTMASPRWSWARLLKHVFALNMAPCPWCQRGTLRIIAAITHGEVIQRSLRHLKLTVDPSPIAPARVRQEAFAWSSI